MGKMFKHVKDNRFVLKENNDIPVLDKTTFSKCYLLIIKNIIPAIVENFNNYFVFIKNGDFRDKDNVMRFYKKLGDKYNLKHFHFVKLKEEDLIKNLKRIKPTKYPVEFVSILSDSGIVFEFFINYNKMRGWYVGCEDYHGEYNSYLNDLYLTNVDDEIDENLREDIKHQKEITKNEESYFLQFIYKKLIPEITDYYDKIREKDPELPPKTQEEFVKNFKKTYMSTGLIRYQYRPDDDIIIRVSIEKNGLNYEYVNINCTLYIMVGEYNNVKYFHKSFKL